jgi:hypothetical protein
VGWRGTLVLALLVLAASGALYLELATEHSELSWRSVIQGVREPPPGDQITRLLSFDPTSVTAMRLERSGQVWRTQRGDGGWTGTARPADVDDFLNNLLGLAEILPLDVSAEELADHGLDPPEAVVELEREGAPPVVLLLGRRNPPATGVYARVGAQGRVVLTGALALWDFEKAVRAISPTAAAP